MEASQVGEMISPKNNYSKTAIIIGAGPAGLTAAYELLQRAPHIKPVVYEMSGYFGGIARTVNYKGNRMDIGGHRFFSKSSRVLQWWQKILPLESGASGDPDLVLSYHNKTTKVYPLFEGGDPQKTDKVMLVRNRLSRIFFQGRFFEYPVTLNRNTLTNLGLARTIKIGLSYIYAKILPRKEKSLEDFFINRFGNELYNTFFKDYTQKIWGVPCTDISSQWGGQRVKGLSIGKVFALMIKKFFFPKRVGENVETSLIQKFLYPKFGPGQMWEEVAARLQADGADIYLHHQVIGMTMHEGNIIEIRIKDLSTGEVKIQPGDYFFSTMPVKELIASIHPPVQEEVQQVALGLRYRDFMTVGLLLRRLNNKNIVLDNWIYIQDKGVKVGRLQIFNNWSPFLVKDPDKIWIGLEYFCNEGDELWNKNDEEFMRFAIDELVLIGIVNKEDVIDGTVIRMPKAYPAYTGTYPLFNLIRNFTDSIENLFLIGRNGMHKYNNQDHSMLAAMTAVDNIVSNIKSKDNIWAINMEDDF